MAGKERSVGRTRSVRLKAPEGPDGIQHGVAAENYARKGGYDGRESVGLGVRQAS